MITVQQLGRTLLKSAGKKFIKEIIGKTHLKHISMSKMPRFYNTEL